MLHRRNKEIQLRECNCALSCSGGLKIPLQSTLTGSSTRMLSRVTAFVTQQCYDKVCDKVQGRLLIIYSTSDKDNRCITPLAY